MDIDDISARREEKTAKPIIFIPESEKRCEDCKWWCLDVCTEEVINIDYLTKGLFMTTKDFFCKFWESDK